MGALYGGGALIVKPDGTLLGMKPWLSKIPFRNFLMPGIILFLMNGVLPLVTAIGLLVRFNVSWLERFNIYGNKYWAWTFSIYCGIITITWIIVQQFVTDFFVLQPIVALTGLLIITMALIPAVIQYYTE